ncbi:putative transcriptional regulator [Escherichia coli]|uniref:Putative transcriptional regulator n=1 Tax=Escherichia coli TaxID=562 RepID=A0A2X1MUE9_ECOLX|nr:putative transcriptional regulator [Escherichia coli]
MANAHRLSACSRSSYYYTFVKPGETTPNSCNERHYTASGERIYANDLGGSEKIELDGKAVISVVYL